GRGRVMVFLGKRGGLVAAPDWNFDGERVNQHLGMAVTLADVNGDRVSDLIVSEWDGPLNDTNAVAAVHVFLGGTNGLPFRPSQTLRETAGRFEISFVVGAVGDVNKDGCQDLAVSASDPTSPVDRGTSLVVFHGSPTGLELEPAWVFHSEQDECGFPAGFRAAGDVNGDGCGDLLASAIKFNGRYHWGGKVYLFLGSTNGLALEPAWTSEYPLPVDSAAEGANAQFFGLGLGPAGDVNGDRVDDFLIGAWHATHGDFNEGTAFLYLGSTNTIPQAPAWRVEGGRPRTYLGASVSGAGDLNGDGFGDVLIGVPYASHEAKDEGVVAVFYGSEAGLGPEPAWTFDGDRSNGHLGEFVSSAGDVNGDGVPDLLLAGTDYAESNEPFTRVVVVYGQRGGLTGSSNWSPHKPLLAALQQRIERLPRWAGRVAAISGVLLVMGGLLLVQVRLRRQLATVIAENRQLAATQERTRIARDIHDHLGADLTRLAAQLDRAAETANATTLQKLGDSAHQTIKTLDELVWATNPEQDTLEGLANYVAEFARGFLDAHGLRCDLALPDQLPPLRLPARARHNLFLIAKEAMRNAAQHGAATRVRVTLNLTDHELRLTIEDDGRGLHETGNGQKAAEGGRAGGGGGVGTEGGNGLRNMRARAEALGGQLVIEPGFAGGTRVSVVVPIENGPERG
ncbi:MAG TPA: ATP-binding protein, partial [Verrucomicrobiota bacterium]|nr:ATP-binding protein [Verrucomicrobiota bacterium]